MNKWQIICPLAAFIVFCGVFAMVSGRNHHRYYIYAQSRMIGEELIATTNSPRVVLIGPALQKRLSELLNTSAGVSDVILGDEPSPIGNRSACSRLIVSNSTGLRFGIRLRQDSTPEKFHILGFWTISDPDIQTNGTKLIHFDTN